MPGIDFDAALQMFESGNASLECAKTLFAEANDPSKAETLFSAASALRDRSIGRKRIFSAHVHMITPCSLAPPCRYCSLSSSDPRIRYERSALTTGEFEGAIEYALEKGVESLVLVGGSNLKGLDFPLRKAIEQVRAISDIEVGVDVGPTISPDTVKWLKSNNVKTVFCSLETINEIVFAGAKPGDSFGSRIRCMEMLQREGMGLGSVVMNGLGSADDFLRSILFHKGFKNLSHLFISTFRPVHGTPWSNRTPASIHDSLKGVAIARLLLPYVQIGLAEVEVEDPGSATRVLSQLMAGAGNTFATVFVYKKRRVDNSGLIKSSLQERVF